MPDMKTTLAEVRDALDKTIQQLDLLQDADVLKAIEGDQAFFACVQARNTALQTAITEKVKRNRAGWACEGTVALLRHVGDEFGDPQARAFMDAGERLTASKLSTRADKLAVDAEAFVKDLKSN